MNVEKRVIYIAVPGRPSRRPDGTRPSTDIMSACALAVGAARALDARREHELCALRDTERDKKHRRVPPMLACEGAAWLPQAGRTHTHALSAPDMSPLVWHGLRSNGRDTVLSHEQTQRRHMLDKDVERA